MRVSVIIPCHNAGRWVGEAIESCLAQTHADVEIIVVDDGSTDDSREVIARYGNAVYLESTDNRGAGAARNRGFELSRGDLIQYLDADDIIPPEKFAVQAAQLRGGSDQIATCPWASFTDTRQTYSLENSGMDEVTSPLLWLQTKYLTGGMNLISCWLTPRPIIERAGRWDTTLQINQDGEFFSRAVLASERIVFTRDTMAFYRRANTQSVSSGLTTSFAKCQSLLRSYELCEGQLLSKDRSCQTYRALICNYQRFILTVHPHYPELVHRAWSDLKRLRHESGIGLPMLGTTRFRYLQRIVGFRNALQVRRMVNLFRPRPALGK